LRESRDDELSWEEFKSILLKRFGYVESTDSVVSRLCKLKQDESLEEFINKFTYTLSRAKVADEVAIGLFTNGLIVELANEVQYRRPGSLSEAIQIVIDYSRIKMGVSFGQTPLADVNYANSREDGCYKCGTLGHFARDCRKKHNWHYNEQQSVPYNRPYSRPTQESSKHSTPNKRAAEGNR
jgi:hypothetical protein